MRTTKIILTAAMAAMAMSAMAVPAKPGIRAISQPDGTELRIAVKGDETFHVSMTTDGHAVSRGSDGYFRYVTPAGISGVRAHNPGQREEAELQYLNANSSALSFSAHFKAAKSDGMQPRRSAGRGVMRKSQVASSGSPRVPILLVEYSDYKFKDKDAATTFREFFSEGEKSARQYFEDQSNGKYTPQYDVYGPITLSGKRIAYGGNDREGNDKGVGAMVAEGCQGLNEEIDFSRYDNDGDGECDVVIVLYAGDGEASSYEEDYEDSVWPCQWDLATSDYGRNLTLDNTLVSKFAVFNELNGTDLSRIDGIGTFCHEFSHCLDLPDFYDTNYSGFFGMGPWSLMDGGCYNDDGYTPIGYSAYEKVFMGWIELEEAKENTQYTLPVLNSGTDSDKAVKLTNAADSDEYYILENRSRQGWDKYLPAEGMMVTHVTYNMSSWMYNTVNDYSLQRMTLIPADDNLKIDRIFEYGEVYYEIDQDDLKGDLWPYKGADSLTDSSVPAAKVNRGGYMGKPITEITRNQDGTISFWAMKEATPAVATPTNLRHEKDAAESGVIISWDDDGDNEVTYTVEIREHQDCVLVSHTDFNNASHQWTVDGFTEIDAAESAIRMGSGKKTGSVTSAGFETAADGLVTVKLNAKYYSGDESSLKISVCDASGTAIDSKEVELTAHFEEYTVLIEGDALSESTVRIETLAPKKRAYVKSVDIYTGDATQLQDNVMRRVEGEGDTYRLLTDLKEKSVFVTGLKYPSTYDCRVRAIAADHDNFSDSPWSEVITFEYDVNAGIALPATSGNVHEPEYYNLQGIKISSPTLTPGIYIERRGNDTRVVKF